MLQKLINSLNVSSLEDFNSGYELLKNYYPNLTINEFKKLFIKPSLKQFNLKIGTNSTKLANLREEINKNNLYAYIISTNDEYMSEYTPLYAKRLFYITGFSGSYGFALVTKNSAALFVDGRYTTQAYKQVDYNLITIVPLTLNNIINFIQQEVPKDYSIGINSKTISYSFVSLLLNNLSNKNIRVSFLDNDLIDNIWKNQPDEPISPVVIYEEKYAGENTQNKINKVVKYINKEKIKALLVTALDNIAWLLNIRGNDIECSPLSLMTLIIHANGSLDLFINEYKLLNPIKEYLFNFNINIYKPEDIVCKLCLLKNQTVGLSTESPYYYYKFLKNKSQIKLLKKDIISNLKAIKNNTEILNTQIAHYKDGAALTKLIIQIDKEIKYKNLTELTITELINKFKNNIPNYKSNSFPSIVAFNENAALPHYQATSESNKTLNPDGILLIDCGGQYLEGTTDVTRTISFKEPNEKFKKHFTLVLKGLISLSSAIFPKNTPCRNLDIIARQYLWQNGLDYNHGTGHGVGHYLSVHEGPIRLNQSSEEILLEGMVLSIEPGYYEVDNYGIRIENLVYVRQCAKFNNFLEFTTLTYVPIDIKNINFDMLTNEEKLWLKDYHKTTFDKLLQYLKQEEIEYLKKLTDMYYEI